MLSSTRSTFVLCGACLSLYLAMPQVVSAQQQLTCPAPPQQIARDVNVDTQAKVAGLGKLKVGELENKTEVVVRPLLDNTPNADRLLMAQMMTSIFCQVISQSNLSDKEKLDRFDTFYEKILTLLANAPPSRNAAPATQAPATPTSAKPNAEPRKTSAVTPWGRLVPFRAGSTIKQTTDQLAQRQVNWLQHPDERYQASFPVMVGDVELTAVIDFNSEDRAESHFARKDAGYYVGNYSTRDTGSEISGSEVAVDDLCGPTTDRLAAALAKMLGNPILPLTQTPTVEKRKEAWGVMGIQKGYGCDTRYTCSAEATTSKRRAVYEDGPNQIEFLVTRVELYTLDIKNDDREWQHGVTRKVCSIVIVPAKKST